MSTSNGKPAGFVTLTDEFILNTMPKLSHRAVVALLVILQHADQNRQAYPSYDRIANMLGASSKDTARRAVDELVAAGTITRTERPGSSFSYTVAEWVTPRGSKSAIPPQTTGSKSATPGDSKSARGGVANLQHEPYPKNQTQLNQKKKPAGAGDPPAALLELIDGWNALPPGVVKPGKGARRNPPAKSLLECWERAQKTPEQREGFSDIARLLEAIKKAKVCHGESWFNLEFLFSKKDHQYRVVRILNGDYDWSKSNGHANPLTPGPGQRHPSDTGRVHGVL